MRLPFALILSVFCLELCVARQVEPAAKPGFESITASDLRTHLAVLTSDSLEGRETTTPGQKKAAAYIASKFRSLGLTPIGDDGYFQHFDVEVTKISPSSFLTVHSTPPQTLHWGTEYLTTSMKETTITAPLVLVGYMDNKVAPELRARVAGHIVLAFIGARDRAKDTAAESFNAKLFMSRRDSGVTVLLSIGDESGRTSFDGISSTLSSYGMDKGQMRLKGSPGRSMAAQGVRGVISASFATRLFHDAGLDLAALRAKALTDSAFAPVFLDRTTITVTNVVTRETRQSENVAGLLEGTDPALRDQVVVYTAHYDHLGVSPAGVIYRGADDDGSGTATVLEIAEAYTRNPVKPRRSVLFMTVAGEEKGLLGSSYYVEHPLRPLANTVADLNTDMIGRMDYKYEPLKKDDYVYVIGSDKISTELDSVMRRANDESERLTLDYRYNDQNDPNQFYYRSDHYNFAKNDIPVVFFFTGEHVDYHKPGDTADKILYDRTARIGRLIYYTGWKLANWDRSPARNVAP